MDRNHTDDLISDSYPGGISHAFLNELRGLGPVVFCLHFDTIVGSLEHREILFVECLFVCSSRMKELRLVLNITNLQNQDFSSTKLTYRLLYE